MDKKIKVILSVIIAVSLVFACIPGVPESVAAIGAENISLDQNFDSFAANTGFKTVFASEDWTTWASGNAAVNSEGKLAASSRFGVYTTKTFHSGYVQADLSFNSAASNVGNLWARSPSASANAAGEICARWEIKQSGTKYSAILQLIVRDSTEYGLSGAGIIVEQASMDYVLGETLTTKLQVIGNLVQVFVNGDAMITASLNPSYEVSTRAGHFGFGYANTSSYDVTYDNIQIEELNTYSVSIDNALNGVSVDRVKDIVKDSTLHTRTAFAAGETVTITANDTLNLNVQTQSGEVVELTEKEAGKIYTFTMPVENVTILDSTETVYQYSNDFSEYSAGATATDIFTAEAGFNAINGANASVNTDGKLAASKGFDVLTSNKLTNSYIQADISFDTPAADGTYYTGNLYARHIQTGMQEIRSRFEIKKNGESVIATLQLIVYDKDITDGTSGESYYEAGPLIHGYTISDFDPEATYTVRLETIGNLVCVSLNNQVVITKSLNPAHAIATREGSFGFGNPGSKTCAVTFDNVSIEQQKVYSVSISEELTGTYVDRVEDVRYASTKHSRTAYTAGETVILTVPNVTGLDLTTLRYQTTDGQAALTLGENSQCVFTMPEADVSILCNVQSGPDQPSDGAYVNDFSNCPIGSTAVDVFTAADGFTTTNGANASVNADGKLAASKGFDVLTSNKLSNSYIQAEITVAAPATDGTYYSGNLYARHVQNGTQEIRSRFMVKKSGTNITATLQLIVYDKDISDGTSGESYYEAGPLIHSYAISDFDPAATYMVRLETIGNLVRVSLNGQVVITKALDPSYAIAVREGSFGFGNPGSNMCAVTFDNVSIAELKVYNVSVDEAISGVVVDQSKDVVKESTLHARTAYAAGEKVNITVKNSTGLNLSTLRYVANGTETVLALDAGNTTSFTMPDGDVTILCDVYSVTGNPAQMPYENGFSDYSAGATATELFLEEDGWKVSNGQNALITGDGKLSTSSGFDIFVAERYSNGYIQADITVPAPTADGTYYSGNLYARHVQNGMQEIRTRIMVKKSGESCTATLQLVVYDKDISEGTSEKTYYELGPMLCDYVISGFDPSAVYTVRLETIGNMIRVYLNGRVVIVKTMDVDYDISGREGSFGFGNPARSTSGVTFDNLKIDQYDVYSMSIDPTMTDFISVTSYSAINSATIQHNRNSYIPGEFITLQLNVVDGKIADVNKLKYIGTSGEHLITSHDSDILYGFAMPTENIIVTSVAVAASFGSDSDVLFCDNFDEERLMVDNGWTKDLVIHNGQLQISAADLYLNNIAGASAWSDYSVEATITVDNAMEAEKDCQAMLCARNNYEFGIYFKAGAKTGSFRLVDRFGDSAAVLYSTKIGEAVMGESYTLKLVVAGNTLTGYVNGVKLFTVISDSGTEGTIGLRSIRANAQIDDVIVKKP